MSSTHTDSHSAVPAHITPEFLAAPWVAEHLRKRWLTVGLLASGLSIAGFIISKAAGTFESNQHFFRAYFLGFMFIMGMTMGSLALLMLQHVTGGKWGLVIRRILEAATRNLWFVALCFVPLIFGLGYLYPWMGKFPYPLDVHAQHAIHERQPYLSMPWFVGRAVFYFAGWGVFAYILNKWSLLQDMRPASVEAANRLRLRFMRLGGGGLVFYSVTISLAAIDWVMSLDAVWYSTIWGMIYMVGQALNALAFVIIILVLLAKYEPMKGLLRKTELHDNGKLLLAFVMLYTYVSFSQFIIIWSGNLPEEITWYLARTQHGWKPVMVILVVIHFALPFLLLLNRGLKKNGPQLAAVATLIVVARFGDLMWHVIPNFRDSSGLTGHFYLTWMDFVVPLAMFSIWMALFFRELKRRPILPAYHLLLPEILEQSHGTH